VFFSAISVISVVNHVTPTFLTIGAIVLGVSASAGAETKRYTAERFDVAARMLPAGSVNVPSWFHAAAGSSGHRASAFSGFVVLGGASSTAGGGGSGAGAAGGGGSGAA